MAQRCDRALTAPISSGELHTNYCVMCGSSLPGSYVVVPSIYIERNLIGGQAVMHKIGLIVNFF
jgi:hypothetical protein